MERFFEAGRVGLGWNLGNCWSTGDAQTLADQVVDNIYGYYWFRWWIVMDEMPGDPDVDDNADSIILEYDGIDNDADWTTEMDDNDNGRPDHGEYSGDAGCDEPGEGVDDPYEFVAWNPYFNDVNGNGVRDPGENNYDNPFITIKEVSNNTGVVFE